MNFYKNLFNKPKKDKPEPATIENFWKWFLRVNHTFYTPIINQKDVEYEVLNPILAKLNSIHSGTYLLVGMADENTAEIIFTPEGNLRNYTFIEALVEQSPTLENWKFTAFKPPADKLVFEIKIGDLSFNQDNVKFYPIEEPEYPDEIIIKMVYLEDFDASETEFIENACFIFIENFLGELQVQTQIDYLSLEPDFQDTSKLIDIIKLKDYIRWREKEFIEQYNGVFFDSENSTYMTLEWENETSKMIGFCNSDLIKWEAKASHPWVVIVTVSYAVDSNNGMPSTALLEEIYAFEDFLVKTLPDRDGFLQVGQTTGEGARHTYYACKDFRRISDFLKANQEKTNFDYSFDIFKDKYWRSMQLFNGNN
ncbi:MAG: DUF695 domain-containing protein [Saprospiraceae bacterium]|nr:DUF695 domain-containing protein [Saprospiraceae bacterium]